MNNEVMTDVVHFSLDWLTKTNGSGLRLPLKKHILFGSPRSQSGAVWMWAHRCALVQLVMKSCLCFWVGQTGTNDIGTYHDSFYFVESVQFNSVRLFPSSHKEVRFFPPQNFFCKQNVLSISQFPHFGHLGGALLLLLSTASNFTRGIVQILTWWGPNRLHFYSLLCAKRWSLSNNFVRYSDFIFTTLAFWKEVCMWLLRFWTHKWVTDLFWKGYGEQREKNNTTFKEMLG